MAQKAMDGSAATQQFFRLFMVPGMYHCSGGAGAFAIDYLKYLEQWVEQGQAPAVMVGAHVEGTNWLQSFRLQFPLPANTPISFTRPVYPYPLTAKYKGKGNPDDAANFVPAPPP